MDDVMFRMMELKSKGFYCSQIMMLLALENQDKINEDLVRSMAGLAFGVGIGDVCGALTGGACIYRSIPAKVRKRKKSTSAS